LIKKSAGDIGEAPEGLNHYADAIRKEQAVTCADMDDLITSGAEHLLQAPAAREHLAMCTGCRFLVRALEEVGRSGPEGGPAADRLSAIESEITAKLRPVRPLAPASVFLFASIVTLVCVVIVGTMACGVTGWSALSVPQRITVFAAVATGAMALAVSMTRQMTPGNKRGADPAGLLFAIVLAHLLAIVFAFQPNQEVGFIRSGLACMKRGLTVSLPAGVLLSVLMRRGAAVFPKLFGASSGGLAGLGGMCVLELTCPNVNVFHVLVWHWSEVVIWASAGALFCAAVESYRRAQRNLHV
jgi:hypothetical protein